VARMSSKTASNNLLVRIVSLLWAALCGGKKSEVVYNRFDSDFYGVVKSRAVTWGISNADAIQRLAFIGEVAVTAFEQSMVSATPNGQAKSCLESTNMVLEPAGVG